MSEPDDEPSKKLKQALALMAAGFRLKRANLRRAHPDATDEQIDAMLAEWLAAEEHE